MTRCTYANQCTEDVNWQGLLEKCFNRLRCRPPGHRGHRWIELGRQVTTTFTVVVSILRVLPRVCPNWIARTRTADMISFLGGSTHTHTHIVLPRQMFVLPVFQPLWPCPPPLPLSLCCETIKLCRAVRYPPPPPPAPAPQRLSVFPTCVMCLFITQQRYLLQLNDRDWWRSR